MRTTIMAVITGLMLAGGIANADSKDLPKCRALDVKDKSTIVEAENKSSTKCATLLTKELQKKWCTADNKGKKFDYMTDYDQTVGKKATKVKGKKASLTCKVVAAK